MGFVRKENEQLAIKCDSCGNESRALPRLEAANTCMDEGWNRDRQGVWKCKACVEATAVDAGRAERDRAFKARLAEQEALNAAEAAKKEGQ